jgi:lysophospholipase L1-like esterase
VRARTNYETTRIIKRDIARLVSISAFALEMANVQTRPFADGHSANRKNLTNKYRFDMELTNGSCRLQNKIDATTIIDVGNVLTYEVGGLGPDTVHQFEVASYDDLGNLSAWSAAINGATDIDATSISGLALWLKAGDLALSDGDNVSTWPDASGNSNDATLGAGTAPIFKTNRINGKSSVRFSDNSVQRYLDLPSITYRTVFIVARSDDAVAVDTPTIIGEVSDLILYSFRTGHFVGRSPECSGFTPTLVKHNGFTVGPQSLDYCDDMFPFDDFWCGTLQDADAGATVAAALGAYPNGSTIYNWQGDVAEILVYSTVLTSDDIAVIENYLIRKYNLPQTPQTKLAVYDGDSIPLGAISSMPFGYLLQPVLGKHWRYRNFSIGSQRTDQIQARQATTFASFDSSLVDNIIFINAGTNDFTQSISVATAYANLVAWCTDAQAAGFKVIVSTLMPNSNGTLPGTYETSRLAYNSSIRSNWATFADALIDLANDTPLQTNPGTLYVDGTHLSAAGHEHVRDLLQPIILSIATPDTTAPSVPTSLARNVIGSTEIDLTWAASTDDEAVTGYEYRVNGGSAVDVGNVLATPVTGLSASTTYTFQVRAYDAAGNRSAYSSTVSGTTPAAPDSPDDITGLVQWLKADAIVGLSDGDLISTWPDSSGNGKDAAQTGSLRPVYKTGILNSLPVARFAAPDPYFNTGDFSILTGAEVFVVLKLNNDPPTSDANSGLWTYGSAGSGTLFPYTGDSNIYDDFGTTARKTTVNPATSMAAGFFIYGVHSAAGDWSNYFNGTVLFHTATNTVGFTTTAKLGYSAPGGFTLDGDIAEFIMYDHKLSSSDRSVVISYLQAKYGI